ncbi:MAG: hypothetical protein JWR27_977 [Aeromicrobium sp.]|jgi:uncharacterized protein YlxW (UPF0749 family)|nr:hypothetical protein [Aeromicrobium sp.]
MSKGGTHARQSWPLAVLGIFAISGFLFVAASVSSAGSDLRPAGGDVASLLRERSQRIDDRRDDARSLSEAIDGLSASVSSGPLDEIRARVKKLEAATGLTAVKGPGMRVTLTDSPKGLEFPGVDPNQLVVHQQDIQAFVNALWAGGAEAISLQGQRLISTSGITCVGNTVVLDGVPYAPPYVIEAIGDRTRMRSAIDSSFETATYADYVDAYQLGLKIESVAEVRVKAYANPIALQHAKALS